ncbi:unnamed protein product [Sphagnum jensenii]|uniref:Protein kinase domain-containing protein n=1 Tax=Sphagnum jensenii TaxID=128206 RepID=A0ABP0WU77_9BRYO
MLCVGEKKLMMQQLPYISGSSAIDEQALLEFKQAVVQGGSNLLASWVVGVGSSSNLCSWEGVVCDPGGMGRVVGLLLNSSALVVSYLPAALGNLSELATLNLSNNNFNQSHIPVELSLCSKLEFLDLSNTNLSGSIPPQLGNSLLSLKVLKLGGNKLLNGSIPDTFANLRQLAVLDLSFNQLSGSVPSGVWRLPNLVNVSLNSNNLTGTLTISPPDYWGQIQFLDLGGNYFTGEIPVEIGNLKALQVLVLADNLLSGEVPPVLGNLTNMLILDLSGNNLTGSIPASLGDAHQLNALDLSGNGLSGHIPDNLTNLYFLVYFNVSHNHLSGEVPLNHQFETFDVSSYFDNDLCGYYLKKQANALKQPCQAAPSPAPSAAPLVASKRSFPFQAVIWIPVSLSVLAVLSAVVILYRCMFRRWRDEVKVVHSTDLGEMNEHDKMHWLLPGLINNQRLSINCATFEKVMFKLTVEDIVNATNNFDPENIIGDGGFGFVYRATLKSGMQVAVKKLFRHRFDGDREFLSEMQTLGKIKHRNLVSLLGYCSVGEDRFLVYKFMEHASAPLPQPRVMFTALALCC